MTEEKRCSSGTEFALPLVNMLQSPRTRVCCLLLLLYGSQSFGSIAVCSVALSALALPMNWAAREIRFARPPDDTVSLPKEQKLSTLKKLVPEIESLEPKTLAALNGRLEEISPLRLRNAIDTINAMPDTPFWNQRSKTELLYLESLLRFGLLNHSEKLERLMALRVRFGKKILTDQERAQRTEQWKKTYNESRDPDTQVALRAVMSAGGVAYYWNLRDVPNLDVDIALSTSIQSDLILHQARSHTDPSVRAAARRGSLYYDYFGKRQVHYTGDEIDEATAPLVTAKRESRYSSGSSARALASHGREADLLARFEMDRLPTRVLDDFLSAEPHQAEVAAPSLARNRLGLDLLLYLSHKTPEIRRWAVEGLRGRYESQLAGRRLVDWLTEIVEKDSDFETRKTAIEILGDHPEGRASLETLMANPELRSTFSQAFHYALEHNKEVASESPSNEDLVHLIRTSPEDLHRLDYSHRPIRVIEAALQSNNVRLQLKAIEGLQDRTDLESLELLSRVFNIEIPGTSRKARTSPHYVAEVRIAALKVANPRNHPLVDRMFMLAASKDRNPRVYEAALGLIGELEEVGHNFGQPVGRATLQFRTAVREFRKEAELVRTLASRDAMTPEEIRIDDHLTLLEAARNCYNLPTVSNALATVASKNLDHAEWVRKAADRMIAEREAFLEGIPLGYRLAGDAADSTTCGLKLYRLEPNELYHDRPIIVAIAGTEKKIDWYGNLSLGRNKRESDEYRRFVSRTVSDLAKGKRVQITGHSLGGGMAQYFAYDVGQQLKQSLHDDDLNSDRWKALLHNLEVVTWNGFGIQQVLRKDHANYDSEVIAILSENATNYRTPFDLVSLIGQPIGRRAHLPYSGWWGFKSAHVMDSVVDSAVARQGIQNAKPRDNSWSFRPVSNTVADLLNPIGRTLASRYFTRNVDLHFQTLAETKKARAKQYSDDNFQQDPWLDNELYEIRSATQGEKQSELDQGLLRLRQQLNALYQTKFGSIPATPMP